LTQRGRDGGLSRGCTAQLVFVPLLMGILEVVCAPPVPSSSGTAVAAHSVLKSGSNRLSTDRRSTSILARSSRNGPLGAVSLATLGDKTAVRPVNDPLYRVLAPPTPAGNGPGAHWTEPPTAIASEIAGAIQTMQKDHIIDPDTPQGNTLQSKHDGSCNVAGATECA
jgi:hypothetical protein